MAEVAPPPTKDYDLSKVDIADFIVDSKGLDNLTKTSVDLYHGKDFVSFKVTDTAADHIGVDKYRIVLTINWTKTVNGKINETYKWDTLYGADIKPYTVANNEMTSGYPDVNYSISITVTIKTPENSNAMREEGETLITGGNVNKEPDKPPAEFPWIWLGIGVTAAVIILVILYFYFRNRAGVTAATPAAAAPAPVAAQAVA